jgi:ketopantoate reductase
MQLTIIGAGAIGGTIGAYMARDGHDVALWYADGDHVAAINRDGLIIEGPVESFTIRVKTITPDELSALVLPCGFSDEDLPIGQQLSSHQGTDMALRRSP